MRAYGILDGGVKGAALAGCLAAGEEQGVQFLGFGGTSAGSIVATLASVGYNGKGLGELLVGLEFEPAVLPRGWALHPQEQLVWPCWRGSKAQREVHGCASSTPMSTGISKQGKVCA